MATVADLVAIRSGLLMDLQLILRTETQRVLDDAAQRIRDRKFEAWKDLDALFVPVRVARGLRPRLTQAEYEQLERQRREGQHRGLDELAWRRRDSDGTRQPDLRDESAQMELRRVTVDWENVRAGIQRGVVLGDPGFGKTMLLWHEVGRRNQEQLSKIGRSEVGLGQTEVAVFVRALALAEWVSSGEEVIGALIARRHRQWQVNEAAIKLLSAKLREGAGLIAIDALDEVPSTLRDRLDAALAEFGAAHPRARVLLSSRLVGYTRAPISISEEDQFEVLAFEPEQMESAVTAWFNPNADAGREVWRHIESQSSVFGDLRCPLLLRLACELIATARNKGAALPNWERRGELYEGVLKDGVNRWSEVTRPGAQARGLFLDFAGEVALELWKTDARRTLWEQQEVAREVDATQRGHRALELRTDLIGDLCGAGILSLTGPDDLGTPLMFTHRSVGEFLAARSLAERLKRIDAPEWELVEEKSWNPDWEQVILFLAGNLSAQPASLRWLIENLADEKRDDVVQFRLILAMKCLAEASTEALNFLGTRPVTIIERTFSRWWNAYSTPSTRSALTAVAIVDSRIAGGLTKRLVERLPGEHGGWGGSTEAKALGQMGPSVARACPQVVDRLVESLRNEYGPMKSAAAEALAQMWLEVRRARPDVLNRLVDWLSDRRSGLRGAAAEALGQIGPSVARTCPEVLDRLIERLLDSNQYVQIEACKALAQMGPEAARVRLDVVERMVELLGELPSWNSYVGCEIADALEHIGPDTARRSPEIVDRLLELLRAPDRSWRRVVIRALGRLGPEVARSRPDTVGELLELVRDPDQDVRTAAAWGLGQMGVEAARTNPEVMEQLVLLVRDPKHRVRNKSDEEEGPNNNVPIVAAFALLGMAPEVARTNGVDALVDALVDSLRDPSHYVQGAAAEVLFRMGSEAARQNVTDLLLEWVRDPYMHQMAAKLLDRIGVEVARVRPEVVDGLVGLLREPRKLLPGSLHTDPSTIVRRAAAEVLGRLGPESARTDVLGGLVELLGDVDVRKEANEALERIANKGIHVFVQDGGKLTISGIATCPQDW